jgi:hypothetical protein
MALGTIFVVIESDATASYESGADPVEVSESLAKAFTTKKAAEQWAASRNGGRFMSWRVSEVELFD